VPAGFTLTASPTSPVAAGNTTTFSVQCDALSAATFSGDVSIATLVEAYRNLGYSCYQKGDVKQALETYEKALDVNPGSVELHNSMGVIYDKLGNHAEQSDTFSRPCN